MINSQLGGTQKLTEEGTQKRTGGDTVTHRGGDTETHRGDTETHNFIQKCDSLTDSQKDVHIEVVPT